MCTKTYQVWGNNPLVMSQRALLSYWFQPICVTFFLSPSFYICKVKIKHSFYVASWNRFYLMAVNRGLNVPLTQGARRVLFYLTITQSSLLQWSLKSKHCLTRTWLEINVIGRNSTLRFHFVPPIISDSEAISCMSHILGWLDSRVSCVLAGRVPAWMQVCTHTWTRAPRHQSLSSRLFFFFFHY